MSEGFILCIAKEGLTDFTTTIWRLTEYAIKYKRSLIIDKTFYKQDPLDTVFDFTAWPVPVYQIDHLYGVEHDGVEPPEMLKYLTYKDKRIIKVRYDCWMTFDVEREYPNSVLLACISGRKFNVSSHKFFRNIGFKPDFVRFLKERMCLLPPMYNVSHIRHTDYTVNLEATYQYIERLMASSNLPLYLATDNTFVLKTLIEKYGSRILYNSSILEVSIDEQRKTLHHSDGKFILQNAILDLFILAKGVNSVLSQYRESGSYVHGFTQLVDLLHADTGFIDRLLA